MGVADRPALRLIACPRPFLSDRVDIEIPAGGTVEEIVRAAGVDPALMELAQVWLVDRNMTAEPVWIARAAWARVRPKPGVVVTVRAAPHGGGGGGKSPTRIVLTIAVIVAAYALGPGLGLALGIPETATILGAKIGLAAAVGGALITIAGTLAINAIAPPPRPKLSDLSGLSGIQSSPNYSLSGGSNQIARFGPIPRVLGETRVSPYFGAVPYSEVAGNDQYGRYLFDFGYGPLEVSDLRIGSTPVALFEGVETEIRQGFDADGPVTLYSNTIHEDSYSIRLDAAGGGRIVESRDGADEITADIGFNGLVAFDSQANRTSRTVDIRIEYQAVGAPAWTLLSTESIAAATEQLVRHSVRIQPPARGRYRVRFTRLTADNASPSVRDECFLSALRTIVRTPPQTPQGRCLVAMRIKASGQINGVVQNLSARAAALLPVRACGAWTAPQATRNPAWIALEVLRGRGNKRPIPDSRLHLASWEGFAAFCDQPNRDGEPKFCYDAVHDTRSTVFEAVNEILATARARLTLIDGRLGAMWDAPRAAPVQLFTPRNSWGWRSRKHFVVFPHALKVRYLGSGGIDSQWEEAIVHADGYDETNATLFETIELRGVSRRTQAIEQGRYHMADARLRPETHEINVDVEHLVARKGDLVNVQHDVPRFGLASGRIRSVSVSGSDIVALTLDEAVSLDPAKSYCLRARLADGAQIYISLAAPAQATETTTLTLAAPIPAAGGPQAGDLAAFGEAYRETAQCLVKNIRRGPNLSARLELVDYAPAVYAADSGPIPPFDARQSFGATFDLGVPPRPVIEDMRSDEEAMIALPGGGWQTAIRIALGARSGVAVPIDSLELRARRAGSGDTWKSQRLDPRPVVFATGFDDGQYYDIEARYIAANGKASEPVSVDAYKVAGKMAPPPDVPQALINGDVASWTYPSPPRDLAGFKVFYNPGYLRRRAGATPAHQGILTASQFDLSQLPRGTITLLVVAVDTTGNESVNPAVIVSDFSEPAVDNIVDIVDLKAEGFGGAIVNGAIVNGNLAADSDGVLYLPEADAAYLTDGGALYLPVNWRAMSWQFPFVPETENVPAQLTLAAAIAADTWAIEIRNPASGIYLPDGAAPYLTDPAALYLDEPQGDFVAWPGAIEARRRPYEFRARTVAGNTRGVVSAFDIRLDVPDETETIEDFALPAEGARLPIVKKYRSIRHVWPTLQFDGGNADGVKILDKDPVRGPFVRAYAAGAGTAALIDATIRGVKG
ncbi:MAG: hypothetical protein HY057_06205 [Rhodospirillales bacterium]|nr:hypothetical protein [Rhodospirillales bacterium]